MKSISTFNKAVQVNSIGAQIKSVGIAFKATYLKIEIELGKQMYFIFYIKFL
jgi:hypothetical protein